MRVHTSTRFAAMAVFVGALACAGNKARTEGTDQSAAARDTTTTSDTSSQNPPGYRGMERDTSIAPPGQQPSDTFLQNQGTGQPQDTSGYSGAERVDTTGQANPQARTDSTGAGAGTPDSTGATSADSTTGNQSVNPSGMDSTGMSHTGDSTGYNPSQQPGADTTTSR